MGLQAFSISTTVQEALEEPLHQDDHDKAFHLLAGLTIHTSQAPFHKYNQHSTDSFRTTTVQQLIKQFHFSDTLKMLKLLPLS